MPLCALCTQDKRFPVYHRKMSDCPKARAAKAGTPAPTTTVGGPQSPVPPATAAKPIDETKPAAPAEKPKKKLLSFLTRETQAIRTDAAKPKQEFDWILPEEANARLWSAGLSFLRSSLNLLNRFLGIPPIPAGLMEFGKADLDSINEAFRAPTSKLLYTMGFRSVESAVRFTIVFSGFALFGLMTVQVGLFYAEWIPKSPKLAKWRERLQAATLERRERNAASRAANEAEIARKRTAAGLAAPT